jgi:hypothetical protein
MMNGRDKAAAAINSIKARVSKKARFIVLILTHLLHARLGWAALRRYESRIHQHRNFKLRHYQKLVGAAKAAPFQFGRGLKPRKLVGRWRHDQGRALTRIDWFCGD